MFLRPARDPSRRIAGAAERALRRRYEPSPHATFIRSNPNVATRNFAPVVAIRTYASGRGPHPPGGTHRMDLGGGGEEKPALEQYGVDLTARAKEGKLASLRPSMKERNSSCEMGLGRRIKAGEYARAKGEKVFMKKILVDSGDVSCGK